MGRSARTIPTSPPMADGRNWFFRFRLPGTTRGATSLTPTSSNPTSGGTRCSGSSGAGSRISRSAGPARLGHSVPDAGRRVVAMEDGRLGSGGRHDLRLVQRLISYITGRAFPMTRPRSPTGGRPNLRDPGKDIARFHTIYWPAMLWSRRSRRPPPPSGSTAGCGSRRRADEQTGAFFDPNDVVAALSRMAPRYVTPAEVAFDPGHRVSWGRSSALQRRPC